MLPYHKGKLIALPAEQSKLTTSSNGEVAQRVADIVFTAFNVMSGSHGSMNGTHLMYKKHTWAETSGSSPQHINHTSDSLQHVAARRQDLLGTVNRPFIQI